MTEFTYPSHDFPAPPRVQIHTPEGWTAQPSPGAALVVRADAEPGTFAANVIVTLTRQEADFKVDSALDVIRAEVDQFAGSRIETPFQTNFGADQYLVVNTVLNHPTYGVIVQVHAYADVPREQMKDVVHVIGTCSGARLAEDYPILQQVMQSTRVAAAD